MDEKPQIKSIFCEIAVLRATLKVFKCLACFSNDSEVFIYIILQSDEHFRATYFIWEMVTKEVVKDTNLTIYNIGKVLIVKR